MGREIKLRPQHRSAPAAFTRAEGEAENPTFSLSFSSELPVERYFGLEVLSHEKGAADLSRINDGGVLLFNHDRDKPIGRVVPGSAKIDGKVGRADVQFFADDEGALWRGRVERGEMATVSFAYRISEMLESVKDGESTYTATKWEPLEISLVTIPADNSVGFGRSGENGESLVLVKSADNAVNPSTKRSLVMDNETQPTPTPAPVNVEVIRREAAEAERKRVATIQGLGDSLDLRDLAGKLIATGVDLEAARVEILAEVQKRAGAQKPVASSAMSPDLSAREMRGYSLCRAILAKIEGREDGFEGEVSRAIRAECDKQGIRTGKGILIPANLPIPYVAPEAARSIMGVKGEALVRELAAGRLAMIGERATYQVGATATGGAAVATDLLAGSFIEILRNRAMIARLGATMLTGLVGKVDIPRQITATGVFWVAESGNVSQSEMTFDKVSLAPKTIGTLSQVSRLMLLQATPDIEALVRADIAAVMALGIDLASIHGTGAGNQPTGITVAAGIGSVVGGTNGLIPTWQNIVDLESVVAVPNADVGNLAYLSNAKVRGKLKQVVKFTSTASPIWESQKGDPLFGEVNGYKAATSNQVTSTGTKGTSSGVCSTIIFGNFAELLVGMWGVLEVLPNPYGTGFAAGDIQIRSMQTVDIQIRHAASFAAMTDALTT